MVRTADTLCMLPCANMKLYTSYHAELRADPERMRHVTTYKGVVVHSDGTVLEFRNCACGGTLNIVIVEGAD